MKLPASDQVSAFGRKAHIKKGYYPAQLLKVEPFTDGDGNLREGKFGRQLIFEFAIFKADPESGAPIGPMKMENEEGNEVNVVIPKFVYHEYKAKGKDGKWKEGEFHTAITPNSAITKLLKALGWVFTAEGVDLEPLIGHWVEVNIDDYEQADRQTEETYTASTIAKVSEYKGPEVKDMEKVAPSKEPKKVEKQLKHEATKDEDKEEEPKKESSLDEKKAKLKEMKDEGLLTEKGYNDAVEQLEAGNKKESE